MRRPSTSGAVPSLPSSTPSTWLNSRLLNTPGHSPRTHSISAMKADTCGQGKVWLV